MKRVNCTDVNSLECYCCSKLATTIEHIPPKSFFSSKAIEDKRLIKVPSCEEHNNFKTIDDEYFRNVLSMHIDSNDEGTKLFKKTLSSYINSSTKYRRDFSGASEIQINDIRTAKVEMDPTRVIEYFNKMAMGLYYYEFREKHTRSFVINPLSFVSEPTELDYQLAFLDKTQSHVFKKKGAYPDIFYYQSIFENRVFLGFKMCLMGGISIYAIESQIS